MINAAVARRAPPTLVIAFNRAVCLSDCTHVTVKVGDSPLADPVWSMSTGEAANDKPANMWICSVGDKITDDNSVEIELKHNQQCVTIQLQSGECTQAQACYFSPRYSRHQGMKNSWIQAVLTPKLCIISKILSLVHSTNLDM